METISFQISKENNNLVMTSALEKLFENLDEIPAEAIEEFAKKYEKK